MSARDKKYSKARTFFNISASEVVFELKRLPVERVGNLNDWSTTKLVEEVMVVLHKHLKRIDR